MRRPPLPGLRGVVWGAVVIADVATLAILALIAAILAASTLAGVAVARTARAIGRRWHGRRPA